MDDVMSMALDELLRKVQLSDDVALSISASARAHTPSGGNSTSSLIGALRDSMSSAMLTSLATWRSSARAFIRYPIRTPHGRYRQQVAISHTLVYTVGLAGNFPG